MAACTGLLVLRSLPGARSCLWAPSPRVGTALGAQTGSKGAAGTQGTEWPPELRREGGTGRDSEPGGCLVLRGIKRSVLRVGELTLKTPVGRSDTEGHRQNSKKPEGENPCALLL